MTTKSRSRASGGTAKPAPTPADEAPAQPAAPAPDAAQADTPEPQATDSDNATEDGPSVAELAATAQDVLHTDGDPVPAKVDKGMVRDETGISPAPFVLGSEGEAVATAPTGDDERNGKPLGIGTDTSGELHRQDPAVPTAATGAGNTGNGAPVNMEGTLNKEFGGNATPSAQLVGSGVRGEQGVGTLDPNIGVDERPTYPSTTLTRATPDAAPMEPEDVKRATEPKHGDVQTSTDPIAAAAAIQSHAGDDTVELLGRGGKPVKPSEFFDVPDDGRARSLRIVNQRVSEVYTVRHVKTPSRRLLFTEGQPVPVAVAETLIALHG